MPCLYQRHACAKLTIGELFNNSRANHIYGLAIDYAREIRD